MRRFCDVLGVGRNTVTRDFEYMRDFLGAPIEYIREANGHRYDPQAPVFELPGMWMNAAELHALLACEQLLETVQPGLMAPRLAPLKARIRSLLGETGISPEELADRVRVQAVLARPVNEQVFQCVADAVLTGNKLGFSYHGRKDGQTRKRVVSPQRLLYYRHNWYLLAICDDAVALRVFSVDRIRQPVVLDQLAQRYSPDALNHFSEATFGIFTGAPVDEAHLRFSEVAARWVSDEVWHRDQRAEWRADGYHLWVPYSDPTELIMEVMRYGPAVEVLEPMSLRQRVVEKLKETASLYGTLPASGYSAGNI